MIKVCVINIGNELLLGKTINTNLSWLGLRLSEIGLPVTRSISIRDEAEEIKIALGDEWERHDIVIMTGGLGPTKDDITKAIIADYFNKPMEFKEVIWYQIQTMFTNRGMETPEINRNQAMVPKDFIALNNDRGTAPGLYLSMGNKHFFALPGVPSEMKYLYEKHISIILATAFPSKPVLMRTLHTWNISESALAERLDKISLPESTQLAWLPQTGRVDLRIYGCDKKDIETVSSQIAGLILPYIWGYDEDTPATVLQKLCIDKSMTVAIAESCSGGLAAKLLTDIAGSSAYFKGSVVSYSNDAKVSQLGVSISTLETYGAVSSETAAEMSAGVLKLYGASIGMSITGIAGPDGGSPDKPVGTVYFGLDGYDSKHTWKMIFNGDRQSIRKKAAEHGILATLEYIRSMI